MRVLLMEPASPHKGRGNASTVARYAGHGRAAGHDVLTITSESVAPDSADLIHAHHAVRCGPQAMTLAAELRVPLIISLGGTDLHGAEGEGFDVRGLPALHAARLILAPFARDADLLAAAGVDPGKVRVVPRGVDMPPTVRRPARHAPIRMLFLGGVRPVKGPVEALLLADELRARGHSVQLQIIGAALDQNLAADMTDLFLHPPDAWQPAVPASALPGLFAASDLLLNTSRAEGASNSILEALAHGMPVAAQRCHGNDELLRAADADFALLFAPGDVAAVQQFILQLQDGRQAERGERARSYVAAWHNPRLEAEALNAAWREARSQP